MLDSEVLVCPGGCLGYRRVASESASSPISASFLFFFLHLSSLIYHHFPIPTPILTISKHSIQQQLPSMSFQSSVPCTFDGCSRRFMSVKEMKKHKEIDPEHEYCTKCDIDFEDETRFLIHKIQDGKHIACPVCGIEFRSEGGRDGHIRQVSVSINSQSLLLYCLEDS